MEYMSFSNDMLKKYNIKLSKKYGQNFLTDENIIKKIIASANLTKDDLVIEVGPGVGIMTRHLCKNAGFVIAVEIDDKLLQPLNAEFESFSNLKLIHADALKIDFNEEILNFNEGKNISSVKVISNLPYYVTTPLVMKFLETIKNIDSCVFMVQKEVAKRMIAKPGTKDYGALTVAINYHSNCSIEFDVPPSCFIPKPDVYSSVVKLNIYKNPPVKALNPKLMFKIVKFSFAHRRKTLLNCLTKDLAFGISKEDIKNILLELNIEPNQRGETLSIYDFARIADRFEDYNN